jgi:hypothetical protein
MFPTGFENAYAHEVERRKDEMRNAAKSRLERRYIKNRTRSAWPMMILSILTRLLTGLIGH